MPKVADMNKRIEDERLLRVENIIVELKTKVDNGLTTRSKETRDMLKELVKQHSELEKDLAHHVATGDRCLSEISISLTNIQKTQTFWNKIFFGMVSLGVSALLGMLGWVIINSPAIGKFIDHISTLN